ncbi:MAG TPA: transglycosylase SLT domain-containing protein [Gammaproteobacteria bacterium]|nr:transglycosylase SLT domain-containing protein [Gammaproteobacteria bacterium]
MNLLKTSKFILCSVLCSSLLTACSPNSELSLASLEQSSIGSATSSDSMWASMGQHFALDHEINRSEVNTQIAWLTHHQRTLYHTLQTAAPYISYAYEQTKKHGLPAELALLPIIESGFNPYAHSKAGANGMWQIMPNTAPRLGLKNNRSYDGCRDIVASTDAALNYLASLHQSFHGDWEVALGAYNWGPGNMESAEHHQSKWYRRARFWELHLPAQTEKYVPKLLALAEVIQNPVRYHLELPAISAAPQLELVKVGARTDLKQVAKSSGISVKTMQQLNPGYRNMATAASTPNTLLVPVDKVQALKPTTPLIAAKNPESVASPSATITLAANTQSNHNTLLNTILKEGQWLVIGVANIPGLNVASGDST